MTLACLRLEPRVGPVTAKNYSAEFGSYICNNMALLKILDYCQQFDKLCPTSRKILLLPNLKTLF